MGKISKQAFLSILSLIFFLIVTILLFVIEPEQEVKNKEFPPIVVEAHKIKIDDLKPYIKYTGRLEPYKKSDLKFEMGGRLGTKKVEPGTKVKKNSTLLVLEEYSLYKKYHDLAKKNFELQAEELARLDVLIKKSLISRSEFDKAMQKKIDLEEKFYKSKQDLDKTTLKARFSGIVNTIEVEEGDTVTQNQIVASLVDDSMLDLYLEVRGEVIKGLNLYEKVPVESGNIRSIGELISFQTSPDLESYTHQIKIRLKDKNLRPGMVAMAKLPLPIQKSIITVPVASILSDDGNKYVFLINKGVLEKKVIKVKHRYEDKYVITGNINQNDIIVSKGVAALSEGQKVKILDNKF